MIAHALGRGYPVQTNPIGLAEESYSWPQLFLYSNADTLIPAAVLYILDIIVNCKNPQQIKCICILFFYMNLYIILVRISRTSRNSPVDEQNVVYECSWYFSPILRTSSIMLLIVMPT